MSRTAAYAGLIVVAIAISAYVGSRPAAQEAAPHPGLEVYIGEGCIHCHSQYRRPGGIDTELWGGSSDLGQELERQTPVLFGNRRQGPDLSNVGLRRSRDWNKVHLLQPRAVRASSRMPSYDHLFAGDGQRGEALLDYLQTLGREDGGEWLEHVRAWQPEGSLAAGNASRGATLFREYCAGCHGASGHGNGPLALSLSPAPRELTQPAGWLWVRGSDAGERRTELARLIKFGRPGTSMAGTEWLSDQQLADLIRFLETLQQAGNQ